MSGEAPVDARQGFIDTVDDPEVTFDPLTESIETDSAIDLPLGDPDTSDADVDDEGDEHDSELDPVSVTAERNSADKPVPDIDLGAHATTLPEPPKTQSTQPDHAEATVRPPAPSRAMQSYVPGGRPIPTPIQTVDVTEPTPTSDDQTETVPEDSDPRNRDAEPGLPADVVYRDLTAVDARSISTVDVSDTESTGTGYPIPVGEDWPVSMSRRRGGLLGRVYTRLISFLKRVPRLLGFKRE